MKIGSSYTPPLTRDPIKPAKANGVDEPKAVPPGLEKVQARQQSTPAADRNAGQTNAADRISRNIARYAETQAIVQSPPDASVPAQTPDSGTTNPTAEAGTSASEPETS
jgi:hypothetical protein